MTRERRGPGPVDVRYRPGAGASPALAGSSAPTRRPWRAVTGPARGPLVVAVVAGVAAGPLVAATTAIAAGVVVWLGHHERRRRRVRADLADLSEAVRAVTIDLRAGSTPHRALSAGATSTRPSDRPPPRVPAVFTVAAATATLGGDVPAALRAEAARCDPALARDVDRLAVGWRISVDSGASLGTVLDRVDHDLRSRRHQVTRVEAQLAGARATAGLLAALPAFGLLLGGAMGVRPVSVLFGTGAGHVLLFAGVVLDAAGLVWTVRLGDAALTGSRGGR